MARVKAKHFACKVVLGGVGTLLRREGADPRVSEMFYRSVAPAVLIFVSENWVLLAAMERKVEDTHTGFL